MNHIIDFQEFPLQHVYLFINYHSTLLWHTIFGLHSVYKNLNLKVIIFILQVSSGAIVVAAIAQYERLHQNSLQYSNLQDFYKKTIFKKNEVSAY